MKESKSAFNAFKKKSFLVLGLFVFFILAISIYAFANNDANNDLDDESRSINLNMLSDDAQFFEEEVDGVDIKFFAMRDDEGNVKTAFDACDVCYHSKKGYTQEGDYMVCNNCGNKYHISGIGTENKAGGGCWPSYLPSEIEGDEVIIKESDLMKGKHKFI